MSSPEGGIAALTIADLSKFIESKAISPVDLTEAYLQRIEATEEDLNAFITLTADHALNAAQEAADAIAKGEYRGPLHGIPFAAKDNFATAGIRTTSGSQARLETVPMENAAALRALAQAGAIALGKANMTEWALESTGRNDFFGWALNPWDKGRMPGGSSSGCAAAVTAGNAPFALGTDTGGSIRVPSALCGLSALKPTYDAVARHGTTTLSWSLDHIGAMAHTIEDVALVMEALANSTQHAGLPARRLNVYTECFTDGIREMRIGVPKATVSTAVDPEVAVAFNQALQELEGLGAHVTEVSLPDLDLVAATCAAITITEAAAAHDATIRQEGDSYDPVIRRRIEAGLFIPGVTYLQAQRARTLITRQVLSALQGVDVLALPTVPVAAPSIEATAVDLGGMRMPVNAALPRLTQLFNLTGMPAASAPCGFNADGLPIGLQIAGPAFADAQVLRILHAFQQATDWHKRRP